ncbi:phasin family protein [Candidatus Magnetaquicoccus inordinatus]|uniref:phasin family protein n=1 Tax=Candidatus Magnetaquicoccus inordinatus TaxID=2496818 RepID=UPI00187D50F5|nr:phasin family protein [Candidatus Magnetaquicoccus inordinatus]
MDKKVAEQVAEVTRKMVNSIAGLQKINERTMKELAKQQVNAAEAFVTVSSKQIKSMGGMKSVQDVVNAQADIVSDVGKMMVENARQTMELLSRSQDELKGLIEQDLNDIVEQVKANTK